MAIEKEISIKFTKERIWNTYLIHMCIIYLYIELKFNLKIFYLKFNWKILDRTVVDPGGFSIWVDAIKTLFIPIVVYVQIPKEWINFSLMI